ncbi:hypothetical protein [Spirosoma gilvum]
MNTQEKPLQRGYLVQAIDQSGKKRYASNLFRDANFLSARQTAFQFAENLQAEPLRTHVLEIAIHLVETDLSIVTNKPEIICTVFRQQFRPNLIIPQPNSKRIVVTIDADSDLSESMNVTMDVSNDDEACSSPRAVWNNLEELLCESEYYHIHKHNQGFGLVEVKLTGPYRQFDKVSDLSTLSDEVLNERIGQLRQLKEDSARTYTILQDALPCAARLISDYNHYYSSREGVIDFSFDFIPLQ